MEIDMTFQNFHSNLMHILPQTYILHYHLHKILYVHILPRHTDNIVNYLLHNTLGVHILPHTHNIIHIYKKRDTNALQSLEQQY